jgi:hypothetical protein
LAHPNGTFLGDVMVKMINSFKNYSAVSLLAKTAFKTRIEIDTDYPRACLSIECKDAEAQVEIMYGVQTPIWGNIRVRRAITIGGKALFDIAMGLHHNRWPGDDSIGI